MDSPNVYESLCDVFKETTNLNSKTVSVEVFSNALNLEELEKLSKSFCSLVWLYDGGDLNNIRCTEPFITLEKLGQRNDNLLFHLPCRNLLKTDVAEILKVLRELNIRNILVLQGDIVAERDKRDFEHAVDLVKYVREKYGSYFTIGVAAYPDAHPESPNLDLDLMRLKEKVTAGSNFVITQMVFDYNVFYDFYRKFKASCPDTPMLLGVYIISSYETFKLVQRLLKKELPKDVTDFITKHKDNEKAVLEFGIQLCVDMIKKVFSNSDSQIIGVHFFSLNKFHLVQRVCDILGFYEVHTECSPNRVPCSLFAKRE